jgi:renalase
MELPWITLKDRYQWLSGWRHCSRRALIIGAGVAGLSCADTILEDDEWHVTLVDKGRGAGGRCSTRRTKSVQFDHGAQYFTARTPRFLARVSELERLNSVIPWSPRLVHIDSHHNITLRRPKKRFVGFPGMSHFVRDWSTQRSVKFGVHIKDIEKDAGAWSVADFKDLGNFDLLVLAIPAAQAAELLEKITPSWLSQIAQVEMAPCWAAMFDLDSPLELNWDAARIEAKPIAWVCRESTKPGRDSYHCWVVHGSGEWSQSHIEADPKSVLEKLRTEFEALISPHQLKVRHEFVHRWRYARTLKPLGQDYLFDANKKVGVCGDWCRGDRVEDAFLSGYILGKAALKTFNQG